MARLRGAIRSILVQCMRQENIPSDFYSDNVRMLIHDIQRKDFPHFNEKSLFDPILLITAVLKHNIARGNFLTKIFKNVSELEIPG